MANSRSQELANETTQSIRTLFKAARVGGTDNDKAVSVSIVNTGDKTAYIWCQGLHSETSPNDASYMALLPGQSLTLSKRNSNAYLTKITAKCNGNDSTTLSWGVTESD